MIETSSKRLSKIKKKLHKNQTSDYYFLISSLQRDSNKENYSSNHLNLNKTSLKNSIELKKSSMVNSFDNYKHFTHDKHFDKTQLLNNSRQWTKINIKNSHSTNQYPPFFQNVKFLKNSRILDDSKPDQAENKFMDTTKGYQKNIELSHNLHSKIWQEPKEPKSNKFIQDLEDSLEQIIKAYVQFVDDLVKQMFERFRIQKSSSFFRKKYELQKLGKQLLKEIKKEPGMQTMKYLSKSIEVSNFTSFPSKAISRQLERSMNLKEKGEQISLMKIIEQLYQQNNKLSHLLSKHQSKNIKMFVKMNDHESQEIDKCKKYLSKLSDKYKILEKGLQIYNEKYNKAYREKKQLEVKVKDLTSQNTFLNEELQRIKAMFEEMNVNSQTLSKLSFEQDMHNKTIFNFNILENNLQNEKKPKSNQSFAHQQSQQINSKMDKSFITKRDKAASCLSRHVNGQVAKNKDDEIMSCSTITKTKNMKKKKPQAVQKGSVGVNLKDQFNEIMQDELINLKKQISSLKQRLNDEIVAKLALQKQLNNLESSLKKGKQKIEKSQDVIRDQLDEIEKLMSANKGLQNELKSLKLNNSKALNVKQKQSQNGIDSVLKSIKKLNNIKFGPNYKPANNLQPGIFNQSQYRIIAMQASLIESLIPNSQ